MDDPDSDDSASFVPITVKFRPGEVFGESLADFTSGRLPAGWTRVPNMAIVVDMRLEARVLDNEGFMTRMVYQRSLQVRNKVRTIL